MIHRYDIVIRIMFNDSLNTICVTSNNHTHYIYYITIHVGYTINNKIIKVYVYLSMSVIHLY